MQQGFTKAAAVVQSDSADLALTFTSKAIYVGGNAAADLKVTTVRDAVVVLTDVQPGTVLPIAVKRVWDTGTTFDNADLIILGD